MKSSPGPLRKTLGGIWHGLREYRLGTGHSLFVWALLAIFNLAVQIIFRRNLAPGEFGMLNSVLGAIGLAAVPVVAVHQALVSFRPRDPSAARLELLREAQMPLMQNFTLGWAIFCIVVFLPALGFLHLPRDWVGLLALACVLIALGGAVGGAPYQQRGKAGRWTFLLILAGVIRLLVGGWLTRTQPWMESALVAGLLAGLILLAPVVRQSGFQFAGRKMLAALDDREFVLFLVATFSVTIGTFLFINADRIVAQGSFGRPAGNNMGMVDWSLFDGYQTAGLLGRSLLWATQPLLAVLLFRRGSATRSVRTDYLLLWSYLVILLAGAGLLYFCAKPLARLFGGADFRRTAYFIPGFATAVIPLGLLQALGIFALASRRYPECFALGVCGLAYFVFLWLEGNPQLMLTCMFGGGGAALMVVLFLAVVRWGRKQP